MATIKAIVVILSILIPLVNLTVLRDAPDSNAIEEDHKVIQTEVGSVSGIKLKGKTGKSVTAYLGIPYAEPPVGDLRFRPPIPPRQVSKDVFKANKESAICYQHGPQKILAFMRKTNFRVPRPFSEDCLTLNIYVPDDCPENAPVLVYIHGGAFYMGSSNMFYLKGETLASEEKIIVVSMNYRLGTFGFLSLHHEEAPGNMGLMDQQLALIFVSKNIAAFGGNPGDVTLAGLSSGSASVGYHLMSPGSKGLFHKAIMQSGVPTNPWAYGSVETVVKKSYEVASNLGYRGKIDPVSVAKFLRSVYPEDLNDGNTMIDLASEENVILPTVDGYFLHKDPDHGIEDATVHGQIPVLLSTTSDEGAMLAFMSHPELFFRYEDHAINFYEYEQLVRSYGFGDEEANAIVNNYVKAEKRGDPHYLRDLATETVGDYLFVCDTEEFADTLANHGYKVYRVIYDGKLPHFPIPGIHIPEFTKAGHGTDSMVLFGALLTPEGTPLNPNQTEFDKFVRKTLHRYGNFIRSGNPNIEGDEPQLPLYTSDNGVTMILKPTHDEIVHHPRGHECSVFRHLVPLVESYSDCQRSHRHAAIKVKH